MSTAANVADITQTAELLHGEEKQVHGDAGYTGVEKRAEIVALERSIDWQIAGKRGVIRAMAEGAKKEALKAVEKAKASVRAFVEHPFHIVKNLFKHRKVRYRGLAKNGHQLYILFGLANAAIGAEREPPREDTMNPTGRTGEKRRGHPEAKPEGPRRPTSPDATPRRRLTALPSSITEN